MMDLSAMPVRDMGELLFREDELKQIHDALVVRQEPGVVIVGERRLAGKTSLLFIIDSYLKHTRLVLCIDEIDSRLREADEDTDRAKELLDLLVGTNPSVQWIFTSVLPPVQIPWLSELKLLTNLPCVRIHYWTRGESRAAVNMLLSGEFMVSKEAHEFLFRLAGGSPYFTKKILEYVVELQTRDVNAQTILERLPLVLEDANLDFVLSNLFRVHLSREEQDCIFVEDRSEFPEVLARRLIERGYLMEDSEAGIPLRSRFGIITEWFRKQPGYNR